MILPLDIRNMGFCLVDAEATDIEGFVRVKRLSLKKYNDEFREFFGEWDDEFNVIEFHRRMKLSFFNKLIFDGEVVGFLNYDIKEDKIDDISIAIIEKAQNKGVGSFFVSHLVTLSKEMSKPVYISVVKSNPAQNLYMRLGFEIYEEKDVFYLLRYIPSINLA